MSWSRIFSCGSSPEGKRDNPSRRHVILFALKPFRNRAAFCALHDQLEEILLARLVADADHISLIDDVGRNVHAFPVHLDVSVPDEESGRGPGGGQGPVGKRRCRGAAPEAGAGTCRSRRVRVRRDRSTGGN